MFPISSYCASSYLPIDSAISNDVEKMATLTNMPSTKMPYSLKMVEQYNEKIKESYPELYKKIATKIDSLDNNDTFSKERVTLSIATSDAKVSLPNAHGVDTKSSYFLQGYYLINLNEYVKGSIETSLYEKNNDSKFIFNNSFISMGFDKFQVDAGYRDHFYGPFRNGAMQISTNAINSPSVTISNTTPFSFADINYEIFLTRLKKTDGIYYGGNSYSGSPRLLGMHLDFHPIDSLEISLDRTFQFGGGPRSSSASDVWEAFIDPVSKDNNNANCGTDCETGNQQASINIKYNGIAFDKNFSFYGIYGGEDTVGENYSMGNAVQGFGVYLPFLTKKSSLRYELLDIRDSWYVHHLYKNGYKNDGNVMGNWIGDTWGANLSHYLQYLEFNNRMNDIDFCSKITYSTPYGSYKYLEPEPFYGFDLSIGFEKTFSHKFRYLFEKRPDGEKVNYVSYGITF